MAGNTEESARFKKAFQTVNGGDNNEIVGNTNDEIFKQGQGRNENISSNNDESRPTDSRIEKDLETKVRTLLRLARIDN